MPLNSSMVGVGVSGIGSLYHGKIEVSELVTMEIDLQ